ncbi:MAG: nitroreductase family protein [Deltaproteobacteria bacterium]|nr:nitroreductase family protein [Candidatus Zymogenaceae bacterium]
MDIREAIDERRAYRSLVPADIDRELIDELANAAGLAPSCNNNQPWRFVFVVDYETRKQVFSSLSEGNTWAHDASMIVAVYAESDDDCVIDERRYYLFDTGMATAFLILRATDLGMVAHPIAGYNPDEVKKTLNIPEQAALITLVIVGRRTHEINPVLSEKQAAAEKQRPDRKSFDEIASIDRVKS